MSELRHPARHRSLFDAFVYTFGNAWTTAFSAIAALVVRAIVAVDAFGATNLTQAMTGYFGVYNGLYRNAIGREVPARLAHGERRGAEDIITTSYSLLFASLAVEATVLVVGGILVGDRLMKLALFTGAFLNLVDGLEVTDRILLRSVKRFRALALGHLTTGVLSPAMLVLLSWWFGVGGYFLGLAAGGAIRFVSFRALLKRGLFAYVHWRLRWDACRQVLAAGAQITLLGIAGQMLLTADRWVIAGFLGTTSLGYYSLGNALVTPLALIPFSIAGSYFPTLMGLVATGDEHRAARGTYKAQVSVVLSLAFLLGTLTAFIEPLIRAVLPSYAPAVPAIRIVLVQTYLYGAQAVSVQSHVAAGRLWPATSITGACAGLAVVLGVLLVPYGLPGVAAATAAALGACALMMNWSASRMFRGPGLLKPTVLGLGLIGGVNLCLELAGLVATVIYLCGLAVGAAWYLTRLLGIDWRLIPSSARSYLTLRDHAE